jgi:hypothetical protein
MNKKQIPDYKGGSIVNLMASIEKALGGRPIYPPLRSLKPTMLLGSENIVLMVIDGLGYDYLRTYGEGTIFSKNLEDKITSVFPSTTATAIPSFLYGVPPQQHGLTGWYMLLKEIGQVVKILPFAPNIGETSFDKHGIEPGQVFTLKTFFEKIKADAYHVSNKTIISSGFNKAMNGGTVCLAHKPGSLNGFFRQIKKAINTRGTRKQDAGKQKRKKKRKKYIYAYWADFDALCHEHGTKSMKTYNHFQEINEKLGSFLKSIEGTSTTLIITSDHGFMDCPPSKRINLKDHPVVADALSLPLCGEPRVAYAYVHPSKTKQFQGYIRKNLAYACDLYESRVLIKQNYFGLFKPNKDLFDRVGDYILIMKEDYAIKGPLLGKELNFHAANHGGVSEQEMIVPLILVKR